MPVRSECVEAVEKLIEETKELRLQVNDDIKDILFIHRVLYSYQKEKIMRLSTELIRNGLKRFIKRNHIVNADGELYDLTPHKFRRTLATDMLSKGTNINVIREVLGHTEIGATRRYYADVKDKERAEIFKSITVIGNIYMVDAETISNQDELAWFKKNKEKCIAGLCDGYCTKPIANGDICHRLEKRHKCYMCSRYITTPEFLEAHKTHMRNLEEQLRLNSVYGDHYARHFYPTIEVLKIIINKLEALKDAGN